MNPLLPPSPSRRPLQRPWHRWLASLALALTLLIATAPPALAAVEEAVFAGGCFWCLEHDLEKLPGVLDAVSGYSGGAQANPTYREVTGGGTGHLEAVLVRFDPDRISYPALLRSFWRNVDPLDGGGQFCDRGQSYQPAIFVRGARQEEQARASQAAAARELKRKPADLRVPVRTLQRFWPAESYHQNYAERNKAKYSYYRWSCGRDRRLDERWGAAARRGSPWGSP
ncbi:peptide-methionine (S)-S-oxide reductase MsrA [Synechococcus sp. ATX 2A4]|uniref:peptide-methionine (S)-S-oxide reductase MsrA n=1 Tax=Synechococcus sp. ATX 2A4 TaxID=2823727 RepID=UPI0020CD19B5|nr:peptide-methionine (S)-S-oxide reductase MsrA [Synechococcus sp. ATX 2A4]MCP9884291.1 peptide-methionine (S)-S-oxide reductase MsrA [Synechococcus sp. ATX 2A4]